MGQMLSNVCFVRVSIGRVIMDPEARKLFLRKGKRCLLCLNVDHES